MIWLGTVDFGSFERVVLADSVTERPLNLPLFHDEAEATSFMRFVYGLDYGDLRGLGDGTLNRLHTAWLAQRAVEAEEARDAAT